MFLRNKGSLRVALLAMLVGAVFALPSFAAVTETQLWRTNDAVEYAITATADGDTVTGNIVHRMGPNPLITVYCVLQAACALSLWAVTTIDITNIVMTKATTGSSGTANAQVRIRVQRNR